MQLKKKANWRIGTVKPSVGGQGGLVTCTRGEGLSECLKGSGLVSLGVVHDPAHNFPGVGLSEKIRHRHQRGLGEENETHINRKLTSAETKEEL